MGLHNQDTSHSQEYRPTISFSRCAATSRKTKLRTDNQASSKSRAANATKVTKRRRSISHTLSLPSCRESDRRLEELERAFFADSPPRDRKRAKPQTITVGDRPPIPSFHLSDDDDSDLDLLKPVFAKNKTNILANDKTFSPKVAVEPSLQKSCTTTNGSLSLPSKDNACVPRAQGNDEESRMKDDMDDLLKHPQSKSVDVTSNKNTAEWVHPSNAPPASIVAKAKPKQKKTQQPTQEELTRVIDEIFKDSDPNVITVKQVSLVLQEKFQVIFTVKTKEFIRKRLYNLINGRVSQTLLSAPATTTSQKGPTLTSSKDSNLKSSDTCQLLPTAPADATASPKTDDSGFALSTGYPSDLDSTDNQEKTKNQPQHTKQINVDVSSDEQGKEINPPRMVPNPSEQPEALAKDDNLGCQSASGGLQLKQNDKKVESPKVKAKTLKVADSTVISEHGNNKVSKPAPVRRIRKKAEGKAPPSDVVVEDNLKAENKPPAKKAAPRATTRSRGLCSLCKSCPKCNGTNEERRLSSPSVDMNSMKHSKERMIKCLTRRIKDMEAASERHDDHLDKVKREKKSLERSIRRSEEKKLNLDNLESGQYRFLPDGRELDNQLEFIKSSTMPDRKVKQAQIKVFGKENPPPGSQLTLTQMFCVSVQKESAAENDNEKNEDGLLELKECDTDEQDENAQDSDSLNSDDDKSMDQSVRDFADCECDDDDDVPCQRLTWENGTTADDPGVDEGNKTIWGNLLNTAIQSEDGTNFHCGFNRLFSDGLSNENNREDPGFDHLLGLFGDSSSTCVRSSPAKSSVGTPSPSKKSSPVDFSELTQRGKSLVEDIEGQVVSDAEKLSDLEAACPQWKENVAYAMHQRDPEAIQEALERVQQSKKRLAKMKETFLKALEQQQNVLDVFELSLNHSRSRLIATNVADVSSSDTALKLNQR